jgi:hypothetical protein
VKKRKSDFLVGRNETQVAGALKASELMTYTKVELSKIRDLKKIRSTRFNKTENNTPMERSPQGTNSSPS